jgi:deoxyribodipyrimidine photo-lyase
MPHSLEALLADAPVEQGRLRYPRSTAVRRKGDFVLYWMQKAQRQEDNPALALALHAADRLGLPLVVLFVLIDYPGAENPQYHFMLEGIAECAEELRARGIAFVIDGGRTGGEDAMEATVLAHARGAALLVADEGKLRFERRWRARIARSLLGVKERAAGAPGSFDLQGEEGAHSPVQATSWPEDSPPLILVETESVVPPLKASDRLEYSAATIRRKISGQMPLYLAPSDLPRTPRIAARMAGYPSRDELLLEWKNGLPRGRMSAGAVPESAGSPDSWKAGAFLSLQRTGFAPGYRAGMARFEEFVSGGGLSRYDRDRNDPSLEGQSGLSPWLHFGQVSPVRLARMALEASAADAQAYVEQLVVRRELALNFILFCKGYDRFDEAVPEWARVSLSTRRYQADPYDAATLEAGRTDDRYWNAAQKELVLTGKMHNYMRMYWGKQVLAWHSDPARAFRILIDLNDTYSLDGRDPNGYTGIAWCFGRHDRPWPEQPRFGTVRSMMASGLKRKFDIGAYAGGVEALYTRRIKELQ